MNNAKGHNITQAAQELFDTMMAGVSEQQHLCHNIKPYLSDAATKLERFCKSDHTLAYNHLTDFRQILRGYYMPYIEADSTVRREVWGIMVEEQKKAMITCLIEASLIRVNHVQDYSQSKADFSQEVAYLAKLCEELGNESPADVIRSFAP